jgi:pentatricopeptide repeat protein
VFNSIPDRAKNSFSFAMMINAHAMCGDHEGALAVFRSMQGTQIIPSVIHYTSTMKTLCANGDVPTAVHLWDQMYAASPPVVPNVRTLNTILRGCLISGDFSTAKKVWASARESRPTTAPPNPASSAKDNSNGGGKSKKGAKKHDKSPKAVPPVLPDASSFEYLCTLMCQDLEYWAAKTIVYALASKGFEEFDMKGRFSGG